MRETMSQNEIISGKCISSDQFSLFQLLDESSDQKAEQEIDLLSFHFEITTGLKDECNQLTFHKNSSFYTGVVSDSLGT